MLFWRNCHKSIQAAAIYAQLLADPLRASPEGAVNTMLTRGGGKDAC